MRLSALGCTMSQWIQEETLIKWLIEKPMARELLIAPWKDHQELLEHPSEMQNNGDHQSIQNTTDSLIRNWHQVGCKFI